MGLGLGLVPEGSLPLLYAPSQGLTSTVLTFTLPPLQLGRAHAPRSLCARGPWAPGSQEPLAPNRRGRNRRLDGTLPPERYAAGEHKRFERDSDEIRTSFKRDSNEIQTRNERDSNEVRTCRHVCRPSPNPNPNPNPPTRRASTACGRVVRLESLSSQPLLP